MKFLGTPRTPEKFLGTQGTSGISQHFGKIPEHTKHSGHSKKIWELRTKIYALQSGNSGIITGHSGHSGIILDLTGGNVCVGTPVTSPGIVATKHQ